MDLDHFRKLLENLPGLVKTLGVSIDVAEDRSVVCRLALDERHEGPPGVAHGGSITTLMDTALGATALDYALSRGRMTSTVEIKVNFLRPAKLGLELETSTNLQAAGRSLLVVSGETHIAGTDKRVAFATGTFNLYPLDRLKEQQGQKTED